MLDEGCSHVAKQCGTMARRSLKLTAADTMAHGSFLSFVGGPYKVTPATQLSGRPRKCPNGNGELSSPPDGRSSSRKRPPSQALARKGGAAEGTGAAPPSNISASYRC